MAHNDNGAQIIRFPTAPIPEDHGDSPKVREVIGQVLRDERRDQVRTLADVAESAAVSLPYVSEIERGRKEASSDVLQAVCDALDVEVAEVLERAARHLRARSNSGPSMCLSHVGLVAA